MCTLPKSLGINPENEKDIILNSGRFGPYLKCENKSARIENVEEIFSIGLNRAITLIAEAKPGRMSTSIIKDLGEHPEDKKPVRVMKGQYGPYIKCENKSARIENVEEIFSIGLNRAITLIAEAKPGRLSVSIIKDLGEHPEDKKPVRVMKGQYGPYIKYKSLNATIPEEKDPLELNMEEAIILIEKRKKYDKNKKSKRLKKSKND